MRWVQVLALMLFAMAQCQAETVHEQIAVTHFDNDAIPSASARSNDGIAVVNQRVTVRGTFAGPLPDGICYLYPAVRREGELWTIQPAARSLKPHWSQWTADVEFGLRAPQSGRYDFKMLLSHNVLPIGPVPNDILARNTATESPVLHVLRKINGPVVWIPSIEGQVVHQVDNEVLRASYESPIEVAARDLPNKNQDAKAHLAVVVLPTEPWSDFYWVMQDVLHGTRGVITGHFGIPRLHNYVQFRVQAFATWTLPPIGVPIPSKQWQEYAKDFLAESEPVNVWLWYGETRITQLDGTPILPGTVILAAQQSQVRGNVRRPLRVTSDNRSEKIWLICVPRALDPWVAGWTSVVQEGGRWTINFPQLRNESQPSYFELVVVVSPDDVGKISPSSLRQWLNDAQDRSTEKVRVRVQSVVSGPAGAPQ